MSSQLNSNIESNSRQEGLLEFRGCATSHFQAEPLLYADDSGTRLSEPWVRPQGLKYQRRQKQGGQKSKRSGKKLRKITSQ